LSLDDADDALIADVAILRVPVRGAAGATPANAVVRLAESAEERIVCI